ncbi:hypothetical protein [Ravibacter arvi]
MVAHLPDGHPEWNEVELKDLLLVEKSLLKGIGCRDREIPPLRSG